MLQVRSYERLRSLSEEDKNKIRAAKKVARERILLRREEIRARMRTERLQLSKLRSELDRLTLITGWPTRIFDPQKNLSLIVDYEALRAFDRTLPDEEWQKTISLESPVNPWNVELIIAYQHRFELHRKGRALFHGLAKPHLEALEGLELPTVSI